MAATLPPAAARLVAQQRRLLALAAIIVAAYYLIFAAAGIYPLRAAAIGTLIPLLLLAAAAWGASPEPGRESAGWVPAGTAAMSALAVAALWVSGPSAAFGFHVVLALPLVYSVLVPFSLAACLAGAAVAFAGGLGLVLRDGHSAARAAEWAAIAAGITAFAALRIVHARRNLAAIREEERATAARVAASERHYRLLAENALDVIWVLDPAAARFTYMSPAARPLLGFTEEEALHRGLPGLLTPESLDRALTLLATIGTAAEPAAFATILDHVCRDGAVKALEITARVVRDAHGRPVELVGVSRDVSERRRLEAHLRETQKLETVRQLAGGVAHDFNNLLTVILSLSSAMLEDLESSVPVSPDDARQIRTAAERGRDLVRQLLAFARRQAVEPVLLDLGEAIAASAPRLREAVGGAVDLQLIRAGAPLGVRCDRGGLDHALLHLARNARDAMPSGGTLRLELSALQVAPDALAGPGLSPGHWVRLRVEDTGTGMTPEVRAHAFEPFFTTKPPGRGTGLGLATVHGIVAQCGGAVRLESAPGRGARFDLFFPHQPLSAPAADEERTARSPSGETILVVEDDDVLRAVTARILRGVGYRVLEASGGREALSHAVCEPGALHLAVVDVAMPGMSGVDVARELRRVRPDAALLYVSGRHDGLAEHAAADPDVPLLPKPFSPDALLAAVRATLGRPAAPAERGTRSG